MLRGRNLSSIRRKFIYFSCNTQSCFGGKWQVLYINNTLIRGYGDIMVQAIINISDRANRILNIIKAKYSLRDKSEAIDLMAEHYEEEILEPELRPEYIEKALEIQKQKLIKVGSINALRKRYE